MVSNIITTVVTQASAAVYASDEDFLMTGTGGFINTSLADQGQGESSADGLEFNGSVGGVLTIDAGGFVYANGNGIDYTENNTASLLVNGSVTGGIDGIFITSGGENNGTVTIGPQGVIAGPDGIFNDSTDTIIINHGLITTTDVDGVFADGNTDNITLTNSGTIDGTVDFTLANGAVAVTNSGWIYGNVLMSDAGTSNSFTNAGTIEGFVILSGSSSAQDSGTIAYGIEFAADSSLLVGAQGSVLATGGTPAVEVSSGDVITNHGVISSQSNTGSPVQSLRAFPNSSDITIVNTGSIDGIDLLSSQNDQITNSGAITDNLALGADDSLFNTGSIQGGLSGSVDEYINNHADISGGINFTGGSGNRITNSGTISDLVELGSGDAVHNTGTIDDGITAQGNATIDTSGKISGGVEFGATGGNTLTNANGTISGGVQLAAGDIVNNTGHITGGITGGGEDTITNSGTILGGISDTKTLDVVDNLGTLSGTVSLANAQFTNSGTIDGSLTFSAPANAVTNSGTITGNITLNSTSDVFTNNGSIHGNVTFGTTDTIANDGTVYGTLTLGDNDKFVNTGTIHGNIDANTFDQITVNPGTLLGAVVAEAHDSFHFAGGYGAIDISGFVATGTGHDTLYFSTNDFANYTALTAHMTQASGDVLITLDPADVVTLVGTTLSSLSSTDFAFS